MKHINNANITARRLTAYVITAFFLVFSVCGSLAPQAFATDSADSDSEMTGQAVSESGAGNANNLYSPLKISGSLMPEEQIFSGADLENIMEADVLGLSESVSMTFGGTQKTVSGIDLADFLEMCGAEIGAGTSTQDNDAQMNADSAVIQIFTDSKTTSCEKISFSDLTLNVKTAILSVGEESGRIWISGNDGSNALEISGVTKILVSDPDDLSDPQYGLHSNSETLSYMLDTVFTVNFTDIDAYEEDENTEPFKTITYTMADIEKMMTENPDQVFGNYFGISGNETSKETVGLGGFSDYFEGLSMSWLLTQKAELVEGEGFALFYGRDNDLFGKVEKLAYFFADDYSGYYLELDNEKSVSGVHPIIGVSKNGYPLLPEHDHELEGNVNYNTFNANAVAKGFETKIGIVKNVSGPFIAGLANLDGVYGGYRNETSGDCVRIDLIVDEDDYTDSQSRRYTDVPADSWYAEYVEDLSQKGVVNGKTKTEFEPLQTITRAEFVKMLKQATATDKTDASVSGGDSAESSDEKSFAEYAESVSAKFTDVSESSWYASYVGWAYENGIVSGTSGVTFDPNGKISRQDMAVMIYRFVQKEEISLIDENEASGFTDDSQIASYAKEAARSMQKAGIINGRTDGSFAPRENASRAEACKMISVLLSVMQDNKTA